MTERSGGTEAKRTCQAAKQGSRNGLSGIRLTRLAALLLTAGTLVSGTASAAGYDLQFVNGVDATSGGTCALTLNSRCRFSNVVVGAGTGPYQRDVVVTVSRLNNAALATAFDNAAPTLGTAPVPAATGGQFFAPTVLPTQNTAALTAWAEFTFDFVAAGGAVPAVGAGSAALPGHIWVSTFDTDGDGGTLREFVEFVGGGITAADTGLSAGTTLTSSAAVTGGVQYQGAAAGQPNIATGDPYKASAIYNNPSSFKLIYGGRTGANGSAAGGRLTAFDFFRPDAVLLRPSIDGYKSVRLSGDADGSGTVTPGDTLTWTVTYVNTGNLAVPNFQITDALPAGVTLAAGGQTVTVGTGSAAAGNAAYTGAGTSTNLLAAGASLGVNSTVSVSLPVVVGLGAENTTLSNQASASGTGLTATPSDNVDNATVFPPPVTSSARWTAPPAGSRPQTQTAALSPTTVAVAPGARLGVTKLTDQALIRYAPAAPTLRYTLTVTNTSGVTAAAVVLTDTLPASLTYAAGESGNTPPTTQSGQTLSWSLGSLAPGAARQVVVFVTVPTASSLEAAAGQAQAPIVNTARAEAGNAPAASGSVTVNTLYPRLFKQVRNLGPAATLTPGWASSVSGRPGDVLEYCIDFANLGSAALYTYRVADLVPANTQLVSGSASARQGRMNAPGAAFPGAAISVTAATDAGGQPTQFLQTNALTLAPGTQGTFCFRATIR